MLEILLPGGTLLALLLFVYRRRKLKTASDAPRIVVALRRVAAGIVEPFIVPQPSYLRPLQAFHRGVRDGTDPRKAQISRGRRWD
jgi:hypothetical protein